MPIDPALSTRTLSDTAQEHLDDHNAIHDYLNAPPFVGVKAYRDTSAQTVANNTLVAIQLNAEEFDSHGFHDNATNNTRFTIPSGMAGKYLCVGQIAHQLNTAGTTRSAQIHKNGTMRGESDGPPNQTFDTVLQVQCVLDMIVGDYVELKAYQNSGVSGGAEAGSAESWFAMTYLGA